uniref:Putative peptidase n=1 Tax=viral metagenome TaxID=1070528 RepID=A0A6M3KMM6_9ZZZZ
MNLGYAQEEFSYMLGDLLVWCREQGIRVRTGDVFAHNGHKEGSNHYLKLAADLYVYKQGATEQDMGAHRRMHDAWDTMGGAPRIEHDMNHYSVVWKGSW